MYPSTQEPGMHVSEEADQNQLELAQAQGEAYLKALEHMAYKEAHAGGEKRVGDYVIAYAVEYAEGMYCREGDRLIWMEPDGKNAHIEISVRDAADNRFIPGLIVTVAVKDRGGNLIGNHQQPFIWHPWLYHYGLNWKLPGTGEYSLHVYMKAPDFMRHDKMNGKRYLEDASVVFEYVQIEIGQK
jgi:hypothetical protein